MAYLGHTLLFFYYLVFVTCEYEKQDNIKNHPYATTLVGTTNQPLLSECICGGTIVNLLWILSAGSCAFSPSKIKWPAEKISAITGTSQCYQLKGNYQTIPIIKIVVHPEYNVNSNDTVTLIYNDIALFLLKIKIDFSVDDIKPVKLASPQWLSGKLPEESLKTCLAFGWTTKKYENKTIPAHIFDVDLPLYSIQDCFRHFQDPGLKEIVKFDRDRVVCTMFMESRDVCYGDAGNPLMCDGYQVGIISEKEHCGRPGVPSVWTRVDYYHDWIERSIKVFKSTLTSQSNPVKGSFSIAILVCISVRKFR